MPVLFQFPRSTRSSKARPLHSAMRKSGAKSIRRRMKTVHFATTKTLLSAPRTPPTLPLIPYDAHSPHSPYPRGLHTPNSSYDSGTTSASYGYPYTPSSSSSPYYRNTDNLSPDLLAYYQPSSSALKPLPHGVQPKVVHSETVPLDVEWDCAWEGEPESGGRVVRRGREKIPREKLPKTPHPRKAIDLHMPGVSPSIGGGSYFPSGYTVSESGQDERGRERSRRREMLSRLTGRSRSRSQQPPEHAQAPPPPPHVYPQKQQHNGGGLLQVPQRQRHGSFSSSNSGPQIQLSSSAPSASYAHANGQGQLQVNYVYPPQVNQTSSAAGHTRSRTSSFNTHHPQAQPRPQPSQHQQTHHRHHSASEYPYLAPPPTTRRRSNSNPPETRRPYTPTSAHAPMVLYTQSQGQGHKGAYIHDGVPHTPQVQSASPYLNIPSREREYTSTSGRKRVGSFSHGAPPPSPHPSLSGGVKIVSSRPPPQPQVLRRRTASNPHLSSGGHHSQGHHHQPHIHRHTKSPSISPHRYLAISSSSHSHASTSHPQISWDMRLPPTTATRTRGDATAKVHYLSSQALIEPATSPLSTFMRVSATRVHGSGKREGWPWPVAIYPLEGSFQVVLNDVLGALHAALRTRANEKEYERLLPDKMDRMAVSSAYEGRWREESRAELRGGGNATGKHHGHRANDRNAGVGLRRVDFLKGRTVFVGLEPVSGVDGEWCLVVR